MGSGLNKVMLIGHLGADPEMRYAQSGSAVVNMRMATSESWNDKDGGKQERTEWHRVIAFGKLAELCDNYLAKGRRVYVEGRLQTRLWEKDGAKRYTTEIVARDVVFLGGRDGGSTGHGNVDETERHGNSDDYGAPPEDDYPF